MFVKQLAAKHNQNPRIKRIIDGVAEGDNQRWKIDNYMYFLGIFSLKKWTCVHQVGINAHKHKDTNIKLEIA